MGGGGGRGLMGGAWWVDGRIQRRMRKGGCSTLPPNKGKKIGTSKVAKQRK